MDDVQQVEQVPMSQPQHSIEFQTMVINTLWGSEEVGGTLKNTLKELSHDEELEEVRSEDYWGRLGFFTRDFRLGNLSHKLGQVDLVRDDTRLAKDLIFFKFKSSGAVVVGDVAAELEISQSINGFVRKISNSFTTRRSSEYKEVPRRSLFGLGAKKQGDW